MGSKLAIMFKMHYVRSSFISFSNSKEVVCFMILLSNEFLTKNCGFYGSRVRNSDVRVGLSIDYIVKIHYFFENLLLCSWVLNKQIKYIITISTSASTKIVNFMAPGSEVLVLGWGSID